MDKHETLDQLKENIQRGIEETSQKTLTKVIEDVKL